MRPTKFWVRNASARPLIEARSTPRASRAFRDLKDSAGVGVAAVSVARAISRPLPGAAAAFSAGAALALAVLRIFSRRHLAVAWDMPHAPAQAAASALRRRISTAAPAVKAETLRLRSPYHCWRRRTE